MGSPTCYGFDEIPKQMTPCSARISSRIGHLIVLKTMASTLNAPGIISYHLKLFSKKVMSLAFKRSLLTLRVQIFKPVRRNLQQKRKGKKISPQDITQVTKDVTMVDYEVTTSKWDFVDFHESSKRGILAVNFNCPQKRDKHHHFVTFSLRVHWGEHWNYHGLLWCLCG